MSSGYVLSSACKRSPSLELSVVFSRCAHIHDAFINLRRDTCVQWIWVPKFITADSYAIDWSVSREGYAYIVNAMNFSAHFTYGTRVCSESCRSLMQNRKHYKIMKSKSRLEKNKTQEAICDQIQYALKISANSMYGALSYAEYNTYSPRCGMEVTAGGRWSLTVAMAICWRMGFDMVYGDTDSIMFSIPTETSGDREYPIMPYIADMMKDTTKTSLHAVSEYLSGSSGWQDIFSRKFSYMDNVMLTIVNKIMEYTCMQHLKIEHQINGSKLPGGRTSSVYKRFIVFDDCIPTSIVWKGIQKRSVRLVREQ